MSMQDSPQKRSIWMRIHIDPLFMLIILGLLTYSAVVIWSASGQDPGMMERKLGQIAMGLVIMIVLAQVPPRVYEGWAPYLYIVCVILLVAVDAFGQISKGAQRWLDLGFVRFQPSEIAKIAVPLMVARFINRDVCPPTLKNTGIALILIFLPTPAGGGTARSRHLNSDCRLRLVCAVPLGYELETDWRSRVAGRRLYPDFVVFPDARLSA
ncbi:Rod shape-determining protein RodA [Pantoea agglomerans]|uniref:Rod shape-determining protein RodA n=1 Tax=Enterobacter agglomerans TaxID=549 RepID=A0A379AKW2_ENTAG|nr:Rod shape-determining protein RodA [Pantoea agglomerans]